MKVSGQVHTPASLPPGINPGTHWIGVWVGSIFLEIWDVKPVEVAKLTENPGYAYSDYLALSESCVYGCIVSGCKRTMKTSLRLRTFFGLVRKIAKRDF
jgi:hypothetical protein